MENWETCVFFYFSYFPCCCYQASPRGRVYGSTSATKKSILESTLACGHPAIAIRVTPVIRATAKSQAKIINNYSSSPNGLWVNSPWRLHDAEGRMGNWLRGHEGERNNYRGLAEGWHRSYNANGSFFQRYIVRDISLTKIYRWLIEILSAILKRARHGGQSRERL